MGHTNFYMDTTTQTIFKKIKSLPKSHYITFDCNEAVVKKFNYKYKNDYSGLNDKELIQITRKQLKIQLT